MFSHKKSWLVWCLKTNVAVPFSPLTGALTFLGKCAKQKKNKKIKKSSPYCPVNPCLSVHIKLQGRRHTSLAVSLPNAYFAFQSLRSSKLNTDTFICCNSVILDGSKGTVLLPAALSSSQCYFVGPVAPAPPLGSPGECQTATAPHFHLPVG